MKKSLHVQSPRKPKIKKAKKTANKKTSVARTKPVEWQKAKLSYAYCSGLVDAALETRFLLKNEEIISKLSPDDVKQLSLLMRELLNHCEAYRLALDGIYSLHADKTSRDDKVTQMFDMIDINVKYQEWTEDWTVNVANKVLRDILNLTAKTEEVKNDAA